MSKTTHLLTACVLTGLGSLAWGLPASVLVDGNGIKLGSPQVIGGCTYENLPNQGLKLTLPARTSNFRLNQTNLNWSGYSHVQFTVKNTGNLAQPFFFGFDSGGYTKWWHVIVWLEPNQTRTFLMPLQDARQMGLWALPQPLDNSLPQVSPSGNFDGAQVDRLWVDAHQQIVPATLLISDVHAVHANVPQSGFIDRYGQQNISFQGRVVTDAQIGGSGLFGGSTGKFPYLADEYGGVKLPSLGSHPGPWRTTKRRGRWVILDPLGNPFFSQGVIGAGNPCIALVSGRQSYFTADALPPENSPLSQFYRTDGDTVSYNFYLANYYRKYADQWQNKLIERTLNRMRDWGFNTLAPGAYGPVEWAENSLPYTHAVDVRGDFARMTDVYSGQAMPDVFDPNWAVAVQTTVGNELANQLDDNRSMGLFVDNELPWAKPWEAENMRYGLVEMVWRSDASEAAKVKFVDGLKSKYGTVSALNAAWGASYGSWDALQNSQSVPGSINSAMGQDFQDFTLQFARKYFSTIHQAIQSTGYKGLYLGCRFMFFCPEVVQACKENCDVLSFNGYDPMPTLYRDQLMSLDMPTLISEFGFGAADLGRSSFYPSIITEKDRASMVRAYVSDAQRLPNLVGMHWYQWGDQPISGIYSDGVNFSIGLVTLADVPYYQLTSVLRGAAIQFSRMIR